MKKIFTIMAALSAFAFCFASCSMIPGNTDNPGNGNEDVPGTEIPDDEEEGKLPAPEGDYLDFLSSAVYEMFVGDTVRLYSETEVGYEVIEGNELVSLNEKNEITALAIGEARVRLETKNGYYFYCTITIKVDTSSEDEPGSEITGPSIIGRWESGDSYTVFNEDGTGSMVIYLNGSPVQNETFTWYDFKNSTGYYIVLSNNDSESFFYNGRQYTVTLRESSMVLEGNFGFGMPRTTSWSRG